MSDPVFQMYQRPWEWPESDWIVYEVMPKSEERPVPCEWVALVFRVRAGCAETRWDDLGWHQDRDDAWDYAEHLCNPTLN